MREAGPSRVPSTTASEGSAAWDFSQGIKKKGEGEGEGEGEREKCVNCANSAK